jgi:hypothetical protein
MKPFLILGHPVDPHARYVAWALRTAGYRVTFMNAAHDNCPTVTTLFIDNSRDEITSLEWKDAEAVWCRRLSLPAAFDRSDTDPDAFTLLEERRFTRWLVHTLETCAVRSINLPTYSQAAENKFLQLKVARHYGLRIPRTLVTAQADRVRAFLKKEGVIVAKPLDNYSWKERSGEELTAFASVLDADRGALLSDEDIASCVTMYQERIDKVADVRMVIMGGDVFAYKVVQNGEQHFDFRIGFLAENHLTYEAIPVPAALKRKTLDLIASFRINFASADFVLTANGEWVFLDLNPNGQWLFVEDSYPESQVGPKFCSFFVSGTVAPNAGQLFPSFSEYKESDAARSLEEALRRSTSPGDPLGGQPSAGITSPNAILVL